MYSLSGAAFLKSEIRIGFVIEKIVGLKVSVSEENVGLDQTQHGEKGYNF